MSGHRRHARARQHRCSAPAVPIAAVLDASFGPSQSPPLVRTPLFIRLRAPWPTHISAGIPASGFSSLHLRRAAWGNPGRRLRNNPGPSRDLKVPFFPQPASSAASSLLFLPFVGYTMPERGPTDNAAPIYGRYQQHVSCVVWCAHPRHHLAARSPHPPPGRLVSHSSHNFVRLSRNVQYELQALVDLVAAFR